MKRHKPAISLFLLTLGASYRLPCHPAKVGALPTFAGYAYLAKMNLTAATHDVTLYHTI